MIKNFVKTFNNIKQSKKIAETYDFIDRLNSNNFLWNKKMNKNESIFNMISLNEIHIKKFKIMKNWLNNANLQRENHDVVFEFLNIKNFDVFRMFEMPLSIQLKWFQFVIVKIIIDFEKNINFRENVWTNATNLNKIYIVLTYILWVNFYFIIDFEKFVNVFTKKFNE